MKSRSTSFNHQLSLRFFEAIKNACEIWIGVLICVTREECVTTYLMTDREQALSTRICSNQSLRIACGIAPGATGPIHPQSDQLCLPLSDSDARRPTVDLNLQARHQISILGFRIGTINKSNSTFCAEQKAPSLVVIRSGI